MPGRQELDGAEGMERGENEGAMHGIVGGKSGIGHEHAVQASGGAGIVFASISMTDGV